MASAPSMATTISKQASVLALPDELLLRIFDSTRNQWGKADVSSVTLVCHRFRRLAFPMLWERVFLHFSNRMADDYRPGPVRREWDLFDFDDDDMFESQQRVTNTLSQHPEYYAFIRELTISCSHSGFDKHLAAILQVLRQSTLRLSKFTFHCDTQVPSYDDALVVSIVKVALQSLSVSVPANFLMSVLTQASRSTIATRVESLDMYGEVHSPPESQECYIRPEHSGCLSTLRHVKYTGRSIKTEMLTALVSWPDALQTLNLDLAYFGNYPSPQPSIIPLPVMQSIINRQKNHLTTFTLRDTVIDSGLSPPTFDLRSFTRIKTLSLHAAHVFQLSPELASSQWCVPTLEVLDIDARWGNAWKGYDVAVNFEDTHAQWVRSFVEHHAMSRPGRDSSLKKISYNFSLHPAERQSLLSRAGYLDDESLLEWPWEYLERAAVTLQEYGVQLSWPAHQDTRDTWLSAIRDLPRRSS